MSSDAEKKRPVLHNSHAGLLLSCGYKYELIHVQGREDHPSVPMVVGRAADEAISANLERKAKQEPVMSEEEITDVSTDAFRRAWDETPIWFDNTEREIGLPQVKEGAEHAVRRGSLIHAQRIAPEIQPRPDGVQWKWVLDGSGAGLDFDLAGTLDVLAEASQTNQETGEVTTALHIRDTKAKKVKPSRLEVEHSRQFSVYGLAVKTIFGKNPEKIWMDCIIKPTKTLDTRVETYQTTRDTNDYIIYMKLLHAINKMLRAGIFLPADAERPYAPCHRCAFQGTCPYYNGRRTIAMPGTWLDDGTQIPQPEGEIHEVGKRTPRKRASKSEPGIVQVSSESWSDLLPKR